MKNFFLASVMILTFASSSFAAVVALATATVSNAGASIYGAADSTAVTSATSVLGKLSTGVKLVANYTTAGYAVFTKHLKGGKIFATSYDSSAISWQSYASGGDLTTTQTGTATAVAGGTWTTM